MKQIIKDEGIPKLTDAINDNLKTIASAMDTLTYLSNVLVRVNGRQKPPNQKRKLTPRERQVLTLTAEGYTTDEVAKHLRIGYQTVKSHKYNICNALGSRNTTHAVALAAWAGYLPPPANP